MTQALWSGSVQENDVDVAGSDFLCFAYCVFGSRELSICFHCPCSVGPGCEEFGFATEIDAEGLSRRRTIQMLYDDNAENCRKSFIASSSGRTSCLHTLKWLLIISDLPTGTAFEALFSYSPFPQVHVSVGSGAA